MRTQKIYFPPDRQTPCVFPRKPSDLPQAMLGLDLKGRYPVIVLIGGAIDKKHAVVTQQALETISGIAQKLSSIVICGGTEMGIMSEIGKTRRRNHHKYPLIGIAPEELVTWPHGPNSTNFLWWGKERWQLDSQYSHFILVPGSQFGDESPWINDAAALLSRDHQSVTILINGGDVSRKDIDLSLENGRPVIALSRTGRLADDLASEPERHKLITVIPAHAELRIIEAVQEALSIRAGSEREMDSQVKDRIAI